MSKYLIMKLLPHDGVGWPGWSGTPKVVEIDHKWYTIKDLGVITAVGELKDALEGLD